MNLNLVRTSPYNNNYNWGFAHYNNSLYYSVPNGKWIYRYPLKYFEKIYVKTFDYAPYGITYDGKFFYIVDRDGGYVKKYDRSFTLVKTYTVYSTAGNRPYSILFANGFFYVGYYTAVIVNCYIIKYNFNFICIKYILADCPKAYAMAYDGKFFYIYSYYVANLNKYDSSFNLVSILYRVWSRNTGFAFDGKFLYIWEDTDKYLKKYSIT